MSNKLKFNSSINSLRGLSILSVLFYHLEFQIFKGGFVGVDIFFVISGYLISKSVIPKIQNNEFSFMEYLNRRLRRILPSYILIIFISFIIISLFFSDNHYYYSLKEIFYSFFFFQNFYYWDQSGYFGLENLYKQLLNTWSLSVEFQFYLFFPLIFWVFRKLIILPILLSLILSLIFLDRNFSYFLFITRFFEFGFGIIIFYLQKNKENKFLIKNYNYIFLLGLALIIFSILYLDGSKPFPGFYALGPCVGASLLIYFSKNSKGNLIIDNKINNFFGNISYSLYLIHWPLIIFYKYYFVKINLNVLDQFFLIFLSILLSYLNTYYFENFFYKYKKKIFFFSFKKILIFNFIFFIVVSFIVFNQYSKKKIINESENLITEIKTNTNTDREFSKDDKKKILIIGNSHGLDLYKSINTISHYLENFETRYYQMGDECYNMFTDNLNFFEKIEFFISKLTSFGTQKDCLNRILKLKNSNLLNYSDTIIISNRYRNSSLKNLAIFLKAIKTNNNKIVLTNNGPKFIDPKALISRHKTYDISAINKLFYESQDIRVVKLNKKLLKIAYQQNVILFDKYSLICNIINKSCEVLSNKQKLYFSDFDHFSKLGHKNFGKKILNNNSYQLF